MKGLLKDRKGQRAFNINSLGAIAITIVIAAVILGLGGTILDKIQGTQTDLSTTIVANESWTWPGNNTLQSFERGRVIVGSVIVYGNTTILTLNQNYTVEAGGVRIINLTPGTDGFGLDLQLVIFNMTYGYNYGSSAFNSSGFGLDGVNTVAEFIPTIAIVAVAAIVIGILLVFFGKKKEPEV